MNNLNNDMLAKLAFDKIPVTDALRGEIKKKLEGIHSWQSFTKQHNIAYHHLINLKIGRIKNVNPSVIHICNALEIYIEKWI